MYQSHALKNLWQHAALEFARQGHQLTVLLPASDLDRDWELQNADGVEVLRLRAPRTKDIGYVRRTLGELLMPFAMLRNLRKSPLARQKWDGVVWYADGTIAASIVVMALLLAWRHRENIQRLIAGTESRLGSKKAKPVEGEESAKAKPKAKAKAKH